jgi:hypothetical protein
MENSLTLSSLGDQSKAAMVSYKRPGCESSSEAPEPKRASPSNGLSISTLVADVEGEFQRREQEKKAFCIKWADEGTG